MKMERRKLVTLIAIIATVVLVGLAIVVSLLTGGSKDEPLPTGVPVPGATTTADPNAPVEEGAPVITDPDDTEAAPPEGVYDNDYSKDTDYVPLPDGYDPETAGRTGTVYDPEYLVETLNTLMCDLSKKQTATSRTVAELKEFYEDLNVTDDPNASNYQSVLRDVFLYIEDFDGERISAQKRDDWNLIYCSPGPLDSADHQH